jgi:hypothetical protein
MKDMVYNDSSMAIHAMLREVPKPHKLYIDAVSDHYTIPTHGWPEYDLYQEVHIFVGENTRLDTAQMFVLPLSAVEKIEVIQKDEERTKQNRTLAVVGISLAGAFLIVAFMVAVIDAFGEQY